MKRSDTARPVAPRKVTCEECATGSPRLFDPVFGLYYHELHPRERGPHRNGDLCDDQSR